MRLTDIEVDSVEETTRIGDQEGYGLPPSVSFLFEHMDKKLGPLKYSNVKLFNTKINGEKYVGNNKQE